MLLCSSRICVRASLSLVFTSSKSLGVYVRKDGGTRIRSGFQDESDNIVEEEDRGWICFLGNNSSGTKKYQGSNSSDGDNTEDGVKIADGVIESGGGIDDNVRTDDSSGIAHIESREFRCCSSLSLEQIRNISSPNENTIPDLLAQTFMRHSNPLILANSVQDDALPIFSFHVTASVPSWQSRHAAMSYDGERHSNVQARDRTITSSARK
ncbi:hypothetical protein Tco_0898015 [Tanacetum coccineum]